MIQDQCGYIEGAKQLIDLFNDYIYSNFTNTIESIFEPLSNFISNPAPFSINEFVYEIVTKVSTSFGSFAIILSTC